MSDDTSVLKRALIEIKKLRSELDTFERERSEPIAIVGIACRFPGGGIDPEAFWRVIRNGVDATCEIPPGRWDIDGFYDPNPGIPGKTYTRRGGYLGEVDRFDARFFGISPREATNMDPQHRLLLEVAWEALEDAGYASESLTGSRTGVFIGIYTSDYANLFEFADIDAYMSTGNSFSAAVGRLSYVFGLQGPCMPVDTACSSSIVAIHQACQSLRNRESHMALAGGVNLILSPVAAIALSKLRVMAPDGRCKTFSDDADGFGRGEGCGVIVLKRLSDAIADRDRILALIRGSAVNQDGKSGGLTVPNGLAQEAVIRRALEKGRVSPEAVSYVEAHGTGTPLGDPIEVQALGAVFGQSHSKERPLVIGSVKTNIGHIESASGIAGLIKIVLALQHREIPPHLHLTTPNSRIPWAELPIVVPSECTPWVSPEGPRIAGVSAFGYSGINAHAVLEEAPDLPREAAAPDDRPVHLLCLSARDEAALADLAARFSSRLEALLAADLGDACHTAATGRTHFSNRLAIVAGTVEQARERLAALRRGEAVSGTARGYVERPGSPEVVFLFTGQGAQYPAMGRRLYQTQPTFRKVLDECDEILRPLLDQSLLSVLFAAQGSHLNQTGYTQPALFALEYGLAALWRSWGVEPAAVLGHSVGEYAAACVAGLFSAEDGLKLIAERARLMQALPQRGAMEVIFAAEAAVSEAIAPFATQVAIAALNGPENTVISGEAEGVRAVVERLRAAGISSQPLTVSHAFHSPLMDPMLDPLEKKAESIRHATLQIDLISNLTGKPLEDDPDRMPGYWRRHAREPVRFAEGIRSLRERGHRIFLEIGPSPTLLGMARKCISAGECVFLSSLRRGSEDWNVMLESLGVLYTRGMDVDWKGFDKDYSRRKVALPTYPFQREHYWLENPRSQSAAPVNTLPAGPSWPLAGRPLRSALKEILFDSRIALGSLPYLNDHRVFGMPVVPAAAFLEIGLEAATEVLGPGPAVLEQVVIHEALLLGEEALTVQTVFAPDGQASGLFRVYAGAGGPRSSWRLHASGSVKRAEIPISQTQGDLESLRGRCTEEIPAADYYSALRERSLEYGPSFQGIDQLWRGHHEALARLRLAPGLEADAGRYRVHPTLLDACLQVIAAATTGQGNGDVYLPLSVDRLALRDAPGTTVWCHAEVRAPEGSNRETLVADFRLLDESGRQLAEMEGLRLKRASRPALMRSMQLNDSSADPARWVHELRWVPVPRPESSRMPAGSKPGVWLIFCDEAGAGAGLADLLEVRGDKCLRVFQGSGYDAAPAGIRIDPRQREHFERLLREQTGGDMRGIVYLWKMVEPEVPGTSNCPELGSAIVLHIVQAIAKMHFPSPPRLWLATRGAQMVDDKALPGLAEAPLWGLGRVIALEHPELRCMRVDLDPSTGAAEAARSLYEEIIAGDVEDQIAFRKGVRKVARLTRSTGERLRVPAGQPYRLNMSTGGVLDNLSLRPIERRAPGAGEIEIETRAAGLNFLDVMDALGVLPFQRDGFGGECSGMVVAVGEGVEDFKPGDDVVAMVFGNFLSHSLTQASVAARKPACLSFEEAAALPITFLTAHRALHHLAGITAGDRVLIHAAAGGVGLTAVQLAQRAGAEVFATAGSPEKREYLRGLGVNHVADSRSLSFAGEFRDATGGRGVDIVLNSLAGEFIPTSLSALAPGGRFVEIGKTGPWTPERVAAMRSDVSYHVYDLVRHSIDDPPAVGSMLREIVRLFEVGELRPTRLQVFPVASAVSAFRLMAQARHIGKVVVAFREESERMELRSDGTYLVTGGLGALGLGVARWMTERGARHLLLVGRSGASEAAGDALRQIEEAGAKVTIARADVSRAEDLRAVVALAGSSLPPLRGVVHAAGVLDDGVLLEQSLARFSTVFAPKVQGAWNLHTLTLDQPLDFFVLFSSIASLLGSPGQGNYAAANAFLDALAHHRRGLGLPALAIDWGPWEDGGMWTESAEKQKRRQSANGIGTIGAEAGFECFERLLYEDRTHAAVLPVNWRELLQQFPPGGAPPILADLAQEVESHARASEMGARDTRLLERLAAALPAERLDIVTSFVGAQVLKVLGLDSSRPLDSRQPLSELGLDSLMAVELRNSLAGSMGLVLPATLLFDYPSPRALVEFLMQQLFGQEETRLEGTAENEERAAMMDQIKTLSESEAEASLMNELKEAGY